MFFPICKLNSICIQKFPDSKAFHEMILLINPCLFHPFYYFEIIPVKYFQLVDLITTFYYHRTLGKSKTIYDHLLFFCRVFPSEFTISHVRTCNFFQWLFFLNRVIFSNSEKVRELKPIGVEIT